MANLSDIAGVNALTNPMTTSGDIIYGGTSGTPTRLAKGTDGQVLTLASGNPSWAAASGGVALSQSSPVSLAQNASTNITAKTIISVYESTTEYMAPAMTSNSSNGYVASTGASTIYGQPYSAFNGTKESPLAGTDGLSISGISYLRLQLPSADTVFGYKIYAGFNATGAERSPKNWTFQGSNDGSSWTTLDTQTDQTFTAGGQERTYAISNTTAYSYYQLNVTAVNGSPADLVIGELSLLHSGSGYTTLKPGTDYSVSRPSASGSQTITVTRLKAGTVNHIIDYI